MKEALKESLAKDAADGEEMSEEQKKYLGRKTGSPRKLARLSQARLPSLNNKPTRVSRPPARLPARPAHLPLPYHPRPPVSTQRVHPPHRPSAKGPSASGPPTRAAREAGRRRRAAADSTRAICSVLVPSSKCWRVLCFSPVCATGDGQRLAGLGPR
jgi:hypothetical protein